MESTDAKALLAQHQDRDWRRKFCDVVDLMDLLKDCVIPDNYSAPEIYVTVIPLTEAGRELKSKLIRQEDVPAREAHLMCALTLGHEVLNVDIDKIDTDKLAQAISEQIREKKIRFPFLFGRALYDHFAERFEDEKTSFPTKRRSTFSMPFPQVFSSTVVSSSGRAVSGQQSIAGSCARAARSRPITAMIRCVASSTPLS